jgi:nucleotide-binding universal stress UspA family protein
MRGVQRILAAVDLGPSSQRAFGEAHELATLTGGALHLLCVVPDPFALAWAPTAPDQVLTALLDQMQQDATAYLDGLLSAADRERLHARLTVRVGKPSREILTYAGDNAIDLIVMGKGNRGGPEAVAEAGSVTEAVVRAAPCAVLVVPALAKARQKR